MEDEVRIGDIDDDLDDYVDEDEDSDDDGGDSDHHGHRFGHRDASRHDHDSFFAKRLFSGCRHSSDDDDPGSRRACRELHLVKIEGVPLRPSRRRAGAATRLAQQQQQQGSRAAGGGGLRVRVDGDAGGSGDPTAVAAAATASATGTAAGSVLPPLPGEPSPSPAPPSPPSPPSQSQPGDGLPPGSGEVKPGPADQRSVRFDVAERTLPSPAGRSRLHSDPPPSSAGSPAGGHAHGTADLGIGTGLVHSKSEAALVVKGTDGARFVIEENVGGDSRVRSLVAIEDDSDDGHDAKASGGAGGNSHSTRPWRAVPRSTSRARTGPSPAAAGDGNDAGAVDDDADSLDAHTYDPDGVTRGAGGRRKKPGQSKRKVQPVSAMSLDDTSGWMDTPYPPGAPEARRRSTMASKARVVRVDIVNLSITDLEDLMTPLNAGVLTTDDLKHELTARYQLVDWSTETFQRTMGAEDIAKDTASPPGSPTASQARYTGSHPHRHTGKQCLTESHGSLFALIRGSKLQRLFSLLHFRNGSGHDVDLRNAANRRRAEDDVDVCMFFTMHSSAPMAQAILFAEMYRSFSNKRALRSVSAEKARFFDREYPGHSLTSMCPPPPAPPPALFLSAPSSRLTALPSVSARGANRCCWPYRSPGPTRAPVRVRPDAAVRCRRRQSR